MAPYFPQVSSLSLIFRAETALQDMGEKSFAQDNAVWLFYNSWLTPERTFDIMIYIDH